mgnify:CR=1 FL=1
MVQCPILINGQQTSFTTSMGGSDWDNPFAPLREIYSNALDEDEDAVLDKIQEDNVKGEFDKTTFFKSEYFMASTPCFTRLM